MLKSCVTKKFKNYKLGMANGTGINPSFHLSHLLGIGREMSLIFEVWFLAAISCVFILFYPPRARRSSPPIVASPDPDQVPILNQPPSESELDTLIGIETEVAFPDRNLVCRQIEGSRQDVLPEAL
uniref:Transmembrane protein n=1 Tax=Steinernema glaseri TaxID=37863 RepID=A0A1I8AC57_9BILA